MSTGFDFGLTDRPQPLSKPFVSRFPDICTVEPLIYNMVIFSPKYLQKHHIALPDMHVCMYICMYLYKHILIYRSIYASIYQENFMQAYTIASLKHQSTNA